jgi:UDP-glucose 4-epimerase
MRQARLSDFSPEQLGFLTYGRGVDTTRMRTELGFEPEFTTAEAFADFCRDLAHAPLEGAGRG